MSSTIPSISSAPRVTSGDTKTKRNSTYPIYRLQAEQIAKYDNVETPWNMQQLEVDNFMANVDVNSVQYKITKLVRIRTTNYHTKRSEVMVYGYMTAYGTELSTGVELQLDDLPMYKDFIISPQHIRKGPNDVEIVQANPKWLEVYTQPFSKEVVEKAIAECIRTDINSVQFLAKDAGKTIGFFSYEEFLNLSQDELILRANIGRTKFPLDTKFTELSGSDRIALERENKH